jgi:osmotically-inducible protein OsmY
MQSNQNQHGSDLEKNNFDTDLQERIMSALHSDSSIDTSNITIHLRENNMIEISGFVPRESMAILAEECVRRVDGVVGEIYNDLEVRSH